MPIAKTQVKPTAKKSGAVLVDSGQAQHHDMFRKILLRKKLLAQAIPGAAYVPFIGDGDIAVEVYQGRKIYGADLDPARVETASKRLAGSVVKVADCNGWPFPGLKDKFSVADFDAYADPYASFRSWWTNATRADRLVLFFTDGHRQAIIRTLNWYKPDGTIERLDKLQSHKIHSGYFPKFIKPWFIGHIGQSWIVMQTMFYVRGTNMLYWGAVIESVGGK